MGRRTARFSVLCSLAMLGAVAGACGSSTSAVNVVATGAVTCTTLTGTAAFSPPLTLHGTAPETTTITLNVSGCTTSGSNVATVTGATVTSVSNTGTSGCLSLLNPKPLTLDVHWTPTSAVHPSSVSFSGYELSQAPPGFKFPGSTGTVKVTGSFAGSKGSASAYTNEGTTQLLAACSSTAGVATIAISSGSVTLG